MNLKREILVRTNVAGRAHLIRCWLCPRWLLWLIVALGGGASLFGCSSVPPFLLEDFGLSAPDVYEQAQKGGLAILDIRPDWERTRDGRILGAVVVVFEQTADGGARFQEAVFHMVGGDTMRPIAILCRQGATALQARTALIDAGFARVYTVKGGMRGDSSDPGWLLWGLPVVR